MQEVLSPRCTEIRDLVGRARNNGPDGSSKVCAQ